MNLKHFISRTFPVIHCDLAGLIPCHVFGFLRRGLETTTCHLKPLQASLILAGLLLSGLSLFSRSCTCDELAFLSTEGNVLIFWWCVVTFHLAGSCFDPCCAKDWTLGELQSALCLISDTFTCSLNPQASWLYSRIEWKYYRFSVWLDTSWYT